jgi:hypothetical protein
MNILQAKISALEKELDAEKVSAASLQSRFIQYLYFPSLIINSLSRLSSFKCDYITSKVFHQ